MAKKPSRTPRAVKPRDADDLKLINGIGPIVESRLRGVGIYTFTQLAALSPADIAAAVSDLAGLTSERIIKQDWIGQAHKLAAESILNRARMDIPGTQTGAGINAGRVLFFSRRGDRASFSTCSNASSSKRSAFARDRDSVV